VWLSRMVPVSRFRWFGHAECKNDASWVKGCMTTEVDVVVRGNLMRLYQGRCEKCGTVQRGRTVKEKDDQGENQLSLVHVDRWPLK